jgi:hypothetical protein
MNARTVRNISMIAAVIAFILMAISCQKKVGMEESLKKRSVWTELKDDFSGRTDESIRDIDSLAYVNRILLGITTVFFVVGVAAWIADDM